MPTQTFRSSEPQPTCEVPRPDLVAPTLWGRLAVASMIGLPLVGMTCHGVTTFLYIILMAWLIGRWRYCT